MSSLLLIVVAVVFAVQAIRAKGLTASALWLAGVSALSAVVFYLYGAHQVAVIELSVGAGLVTVLFVLAINIAGDETVSAKPVLPWPLIIGLVLLFVVLLGWFILASPVIPIISTQTNNPFAEVIWQERGLDVLVQVVLIFSGVLGLLGLLAEAKGPLDGSLVEEVAARRDREMDALENRVQQQEMTK